MMKKENAHYGEVNSNYREARDHVPHIYCAFRQRSQRCLRGRKLSPRCNRVRPSRSGMYVKILPNRLIGTAKVRVARGSRESPVRLRTGLLVLPPTTQ